MPPWPVLICSENICLSVAEGQRQVAMSGTSRPRVESRTTESNALWPSTQLCDFRVFDVTESAAMLQRYIFQIACSSLVRSITRVLIQCVPELSRNVLTDVGFLTDQAAAHADTTKQGHPLRNRLVIDVVKMHLH
jgi:hypothetical protein